MNMHHIGYLSHDDPLYRYICCEILPPAGPAGARNFKVYRLSSSNEVYLYEDEQARLRLVGKFFRSGAGEKVNPAQKMEREFSNLRFLRACGLSGHPHRVVRPLGRCAAINNVLIEEYCEGVPLTDFIREAIGGGKEEALLTKLAALAGFLGSLHSRTAVREKVDFAPACDYLSKVINQLAASRVVTAREAAELAELGRLWRARPEMWEESQVIVHGDATPPHFLFGEGPAVTAIDLERMKYADRACDLGWVAGELKHFFMQYARAKSMAEPFTGHFLRAYASCFARPDGMLDRLDRRLPFYMAVAQLRIARNAWLDAGYRRELALEAKLTLGSLPGSF
ncbi:MAG: phosphotransferase [Peptococcaceae bacterium]|nr:phosphotransferase [Peptococcaceae bacterium]